ncbi:DNA polymerase epsilon subunit 3 [Tetrabaena socialis]|uniref:DNA polymerase epsilon subunit 3 n=1 Tax=Tetrabaena socialis TaxID=47790 RepID=A0A2J7ZSN7_9CHLO|nr:DNA polymerase epsilon subunit 3 [Tetrabaena socialis]|eukprot:PNH03268.1 DNA polymerase epsilon subunit 3 [Tetrabaena socialis]
MEKPETDVDLPRALVKRIVKAKLTALAGDDGKEFGMSKDALTALSESTKVFISLIASTANDICQEKRRQTVNADDVLTALTDMDFPELVGPLKEQLEGALRPGEGAFAALCV